MSALGQKQTFAVQNGMSALTPKADIGGRSRNVRFVPKADLVMRRVGPAYRFHFAAARNQ